MGKRSAVSPEAQARYEADVAVAQKFPELLDQAQAAEQELRDAQAVRASLLEVRRLAKEFDAALTSVMRAAYAAERAEIGPRGYDDRIYRRKALATPSVKTWSQEAERLLTLRETHRLTGLIRVPSAVGRTAGSATAPAA
jgi:hypothetical protein